jgi:hypothetical protein
MDYTTNPDINNVGDGLDMDMVHDFGEGVGLDMRDFPVHEVDDLEDKHLGTWAGRLSLFDAGSGGRDEIFEDRVTATL